ncbi:ARM repeat-containing protein [Basidiobolus meristosporus CBS 931.73]|uniref:MMS19 nucleotide excision repair protein n=1 Tax=Basidiobolus meristosporus CBS 931.73 TaxID=1314790 RepID=A0A1Y1Y0Q0_9FUNG|nr:ARM repeat-containing protein [Basidiobolus meristosporus CBS 931.73]|eukprot:ORX91539.1 ARM repeat-containing protein [Basidiobolus meristosporus CBS 931.73]
MEGRLVRNYIVNLGETSGEASSVLKEIIEGIDLGQTTLLNLVQALEEFLTNDDNSLRAKGTNLLSTVLAACSKEQVNSKAVSVLLGFYSDRLTDASCLHELLKGLLALQRFKWFGSSASVKSAESIFASVDMNTLTQATRHVVFQILYGLLENHITSIKTMKEQFVTGYLNIMDGEKDPRNLILAFKSVKIIIDNFDITNQVESLFEVTFCYFPITFKPPPGDPYGITASDLKLALRQCLAATPLFAKHSMPLLLDKLMSTSGNAQLDSLETLAQCIPVYGAESIESHVLELRAALEDELLELPPVEMENIVMSVIIVLVRTLANSEQTDKQVLMEFINQNIQDSMDAFNEAVVPKPRAVGKLLRATASGSTLSNRKVVESIVPFLTDLYGRIEFTAKKNIILETLLDLIEANRELYSIGDSQSNPAGESTPLIAFKDKLFEIYSSALKSSNEHNELRSVGLRGLCAMVLVDQLLSDNEAGVAVQHIDSALFDEISQSISQEALDSLNSIAPLRPYVIRNITLHDVLSVLPDTNVEVSLGQRKKIEKSLKYIESICIEPVLFEAATSSLLQYFEKYTAEARSDGTLPFLVLSTIRAILKTKYSKGHSDISLVLNSLVTHLYSIAISNAIENHQSLLADTNILTEIAKISNLVFRSLDAQEQTLFIEKVFEVFYKGNTNSVVFNIATLGATEFYPLKPSSSLAQTNLSILFTSILCCLRKEVAIPVADVSGFLSELLESAMSSDNLFQRLSLAQCVGSIVNKWTSASDFEGFVKGDINKLREILLHAEDIALRVKALEILQWVSRALVLRTHSAGFQLATDMCGLLNQAQLGKQVANGFETLIGDNEWVLDKSSFCTVRLLHKQRFFNHCLPMILDGFTNSPEGVKENYLIALSQILVSVPKQVLLSSISSLLPLLLSSLNFPEAGLKASTLHTLSILIEETPQLVTEHVSTILPLLLQLTLRESSNSMVVRINALKCLSLVAGKIPYDVLHPYKSQILKELLKPVDDTKRIVRKEAVICRNRWFMLTGPPTQ